MINKLEEKRFSELTSFFSEETLDSIAMGKIIGGAGNSVAGCGCSIENGVCPTNEKDCVNNNNHVPGCGDSTATPTSTSTPTSKFGIINTNCAPI